MTILPSIIGVPPFDRRRRRTSSGPVRNHDLAQYPCFFRAGYFEARSLLGARQSNAIAPAVMAISRDNFRASVRRVSSSEQWLYLGDAGRSGGAAFGGVAVGDAVGERDAFDDAGQPVRAVQLAPCLRRRPYQGEDHELRGLLRQRALGAHGPMADGGEHALDWVRRAQMVSVFGREVVRQASRASVSLVRQATPRAYLAPYFSLKVSMAASAAARVPACAVSRRSAVTVGCMDLGKCLRTFDIL